MPYHKWADIKRGREEKTSRIRRFIEENGLPYSVDDLWRVELDLEALRECCARNIRPTPETVNAILAAKTTP